jgi:hypothetical protein
MEAQVSKLTIKMPKPKKIKEPKAPRVAKKKTKSVFKVENGNFLVHFD